MQLVVSLDVWAKEFPGAVTVCDRNGRILDMNDKAARTFQNDGGSGLIGKNVLDCHPEKARTKLKGMLSSGQTNCYTIEKNGARKLIFQSPWYDHGTYSGFVELSFEIPEKLPHFVRE
jgi:transcriptional regulator with PAS, ATPase and Fis domain